MNFKKKYFLLLITLSLLLVSCSKSDDGIPSDLELNNFVWRGLNAFYLWQDDVPDLQDTRFSNQEQLNNYLSGFTNPESLFENLLNRPTDRFSVIVDDFIALENAFQGISLSTGMEFGLVTYRDNDTNVFGYVRYVVPNSSAANEGVKRGDIFTSVNNIQLTRDNFGNLLFSNQDNLTIGFADYNDGNPIANGISNILNKTQIQENPIAVTNIISQGTKKIGYVLYNQFVTDFDEELNTVFANLKSENIIDLVIDLRYNLGGSVRTATRLGSMITGQFGEEIFSQQIWNSKVIEANPAEFFVNNFVNNIDGTPLNSLGLERVYFIVSGSSASASELIINSLRAYIDVTLIGTQTVGKQEGSITLYDSDNFRRNGSNLNSNHTYAMQPIVLEISNKNKNNEPLGFVPGANIPGVEIAEDFGNLGKLGETSDPLLNAAVNLITTGAKTNFAGKSDFYAKEIYNSAIAKPMKDNMYINLEDLQLK